MGLVATQADFRLWLVGEDGDAGQRLDLHDARGLSVYLNTYRGQLMACLEESFEKTLAWLGTNQFASTAAHHIEQCSPHSWTLDDYSKGFPATLGAMFPDDPEVRELAILEQALNDAFVAADCAAVDVESLAGIDWEKAVLSPIPSLRKIEFRTNAPEVWSALDSQKNVPSATYAADPRPFVLWRRNWICRFRALEADEAVAIAMIAEEGSTFEAICQRLIEIHGTGEGITRGGALLLQWAEDGVLRLPCELG